MNVLAYAVTYPTAIVGIIGTLLLLKQIFRIDPAREAAEIAANNRRHMEAPQRRDDQLAADRVASLK